MLKPFTIQLAILIAIAKEKRTNEKDHYEANNIESKIINNTYRLRAHEMHSRMRAHTSISQLRYTFEKKQKKTYQSAEISYVYCVEFGAIIGYRQSTPHTSQVFNISF